MLKAEEGEETVSERSGGDMVCCGCLVADLVDASTRLIRWQLLSVRSGRINRY